MKSPLGIANDELRQKLQEGFDALARGDYIELEDDAAISRFVAEQVRRSCERIEKRQNKE
jgi:hypothetical protein